MNYMVKPGDTLWDIAGRELGDHLRWQEVARMNNLLPPYKMFIGQTLCLPRRAMQTLVGNQRVSGGSGAAIQERGYAHGSIGSQRIMQGSMVVEQGTNTHLARGFLFILADEVLPSQKVVRKVLSLPPTTNAEAIVANPEIYGIKPVNPNSAVTLGEHALGSNYSRYTSASIKPKGAPNISGRPVYIDKAKAQAAGVTIHSTQEIVDDLTRIAKTNPNMADRIAKLKHAITNIEGEVLLEGTIPRSAIKSGTAMAVTRSLRVVQFVGFAFTAYDLGNATVKSVKTDSAKPIMAETLRQTGGWGGALTGIEIGGTIGAAFGIETGPGAILTGAIGALIFGTAGYFGADWIADFIDKN